MSKTSNLKSFLIRLVFSILIIGLSLKQIQENNQFIKSAQDNVYKAKDFLQSLRIDNIGILYQLIPKFILIMNYSLIIAAVLFLIQMDGYMLFVYNSFLIQFVFVHNVFLDNSSKCYLISSTYLSIYGCFYYFSK